MSKENSIRIGGASGFWGDSSTAVPQLVNRGDVQYLVFDYLAELTMSLLASARMKDPALGYATDFVEQLRPSLADILRRGIKLVSNAGGVNPAGCAAAVAALAHELGLAPKIAVVEGDDVLPLIPELRAGDVREFETGQALPETIQTANAYLGAIPIKHALDAGADIVITGRCVDSAVLLIQLLRLLLPALQLYQQFAYFPSFYFELRLRQLEGILRSDRAILLVIFPFHIFEVLAQCVLIIVKGSVGFFVFGHDRDKFLQADNTDLTSSSRLCV